MPQACGTFPDLGSHPCLQHWWADSFLLYFRESPHTVLITAALQYSLKSGSVTPLLLCFFLKIVLATWVLCVCVSIKILQRFVLAL